MKILHVLDSLNRGGTEMLTLDVCRNARANGLDLTFAATGGGKLEDDFEDSGVDFFRFQRRLPVDPFLAVKLRRLIRKKQIDIIHTHQPVDGLHAYLATLGIRTKLVMSFQGFIPDLKNRIAIRFLMPRNNANIACSYGLLEHLAKSDNLDTSGFKMIYNGVDQRRIEYHGESLRRELGIEDVPLLFGMVAHFYPAERKDHITLCRAFTLIADRVPNAHLALVGRVEKGAKSKFEECQRIVSECGLSDRVHFLGERRDLPKIIASLDVYVFSSFYEGLPIALMEALLSKKACILSDIPQHLEISQDGMYAESFRTGDAEDLAAKLVRIAEDGPYRNDLAERAYEFGKRTFSIETHIGELKKLYAELLDQ